MKKNRRIKRLSRFTSGATGIAALIVSSFIMLMIYWSLDVRCTAILREIGRMFISTHHTDLERQLYQV